MGTKQENRERHIKRIFIESAKELMRDVGAEHLTVKAVADRAGYSPGTLYNYFRDQQALLYACAQDAFAECAARVKQAAAALDSPVERVVRPALVYTSFFLENPDVFELLFIYDLGDATRDGPESGRYVPEPITLTEQHIRECAEAGIIEMRNAETVLGLVSNVVHGNLLFFMHNRLPVSSDELLMKSERELRFIFEHCGAGGQASDKEGGDAANQSSRQAIDKSDGQAGR